MNISKHLSPACLAVLLAAVLSLPAAAADIAKAQLKDTSGKEMGEVDMMQTPQGVLVRISVKGVAPGEKAIHIHAVGKCEPPFESAGSHFNPTNAKHGMLAGQGHAGDMPNLHIPQSGDLVVEMLNPAVTLEKGKPNSLLDADGSTVIIHANADDYRTDPTGNSGGRIICGVISESATVGSPPPR